MQLNLTGYERVILTEERSLPEEHLVDNDPDCPKIDTSPIWAVLEEHFRRFVLFGAAVPTSHGIFVELANCVKVNHFEVAIGVEHHIFQLEVSMNKLVRLQQTQSEKKLRYVELGKLLRESLSLLQHCM